MFDDVNDCLLFGLDNSYFIREIFIVRVSLY